MKEALLGICAGKFNTVLTFLRFVLISLEIYILFHSPHRPCPSFLISILALLLQWGCPTLGFPWPHWPSCGSKGKCHRRMALLAYGSVQIGPFLPLSTVLRHTNVFLHLSSEMTKQEMERLRGNAQVPVSKKCMQHCENAWCHATAAIDDLGDWTKLK